jgi:hypothetical protein
LRKTKNQNIIFLAFNQLYASLLAKVCFTKICLIQIWVAFSNHIECVSQSLFYKLLFYCFRKIRVQTLFLLSYASEAIRLNQDLLLKTLL